MAITYDSHPFGLLTITAPSNKWTLRGNGFFEMWTAGAELPFEWTAAGALRGIVGEEARTNLFLYSSDYDNAAWSKHNATVTANALAGIFGTVTADKLVEDTATSQHRVRQVIVKAASALTYTGSVFLKAGERTRAEIQFYDGAGSNGVSAAVDLSNGTFVTALATFGAGWAVVGSEIEAYPNGWYRVCLSYTTNTDTALRLSIHMISAGTTTTYLGDGASGLYLGHAQLEQAVDATSPIPTTSATVTRARDRITLAAASFPLNALAGTLFAEYECPVIRNATRYFAVLDDNTASEYVAITSFDTAGHGSVVDGAVAQATLTHLTTQVAGQVQKAAVAYAANDFASCRNGGAVQTDAAGTLPTITQLSFCGNGAFPFGRIYLRKAAYFPRRMSNAELQALTT